MNSVVGVLRLDIAAVSFSDEPRDVETEAQMLVIFPAEPRPSNRNSCVRMRSGSGGPGFSTLDTSDPSSLSGRSR